MSILDAWTLQYFPCRLLTGRRPRYADARQGGTNDGGCLALSLD